MRKLWSRILGFVSLCCMFLGTMAYAQPVPADFTLRVTAGGLAPWSQATTINIDASGHATATRYTTGGISTILAETTFTVSPLKVQKLWQAIQDSSFFSLASPSPDTTISDGSFAKISVTANGASHQVLIKNTAQPQIQSLIDSVSAATPPSLQLYYHPPVQLNILPRDPCNPQFGSAGTGSTRTPTTMSPSNPKSKSWSSTLTISSTPSINAEVVPPHPGAVVACDVPLSQAVANHSATLKSKGLYFGDAMSLTVDNRFPKPCNTITITLYLEFWGPLATQANVDKIDVAIYSKWMGHTNSSGAKINVEIITRANQGATAPPGTPGYEQIQLVDQGVERSHVSGTGRNNGIVSGVWEVPMSSGTYAHEVGHILGLPDRYDDYSKQADGSWVNRTSGKSYANNDLFAAYVVSKEPNQNLDVMKAFLMNVDLYSIARDGSENDLMADMEKPIRQSDIDQITSNPGLLVRTPAKTVLVNKNVDAQNIVVTHSEDLFVKPGEKRTLNGIYGACIDAHKNVPEYSGLFDVIPSLESWKGITAAGYLSQLIHFIDSAGVYCGLNFAASDAIWRITDNSLSFPDDDVQVLLSLAGIHLGDEVLDFPRLTSRSINDTTTFSFVPDELFAANIQPRFADGIPGNKVTLTASVSQPVDAGFTTDFSWTANGPDTAAVPISVNGSSGSLTPVRRGVYEVGLNVSVTDSTLNKRTFKAPGKAYVIVPDSSTETFEHANLTDKFPWRTSGDVPWSISGTNAQTGSSAAHPGSLAPHQTSVLAIDLALPADGAITFSVRTATAEHLDQCQFLIDSVSITQFSGITDWKISTYSLKAGNHTLAWKNTSPVSTAGKIWLDNVFFPPHSFVTSAQTGESTIPVAYLLYQNYPNPFNPSTTIRYGLPHKSNVSLAVFNTLGQQVATLVQGDQEAGYHEVRFDASGLSSGVYFYRLQAGTFVETRKLLLLR